GAGRWRRDGRRPLPRGFRRPRDHRAVPPERDRVAPFPHWSRVQVARSQPTTVRERPIVQDSIRLAPHPRAPRASDGQLTRWLSYTARRGGWTAALPAGATPIWPGRNGASAPWAEVLVRGVAENRLPHGGAI